MNNSYLFVRCRSHRLAILLALLAASASACTEVREGDIVQINAALNTGDRFVVAGGLREYEEGEYQPYATMAVLAASTDGESWEPHLPDISAEWTAVATGDARYIAVSGCVDGDGAVAISEGGSTWTAYSGLPDACFHSAAVCDGRFFAAQRPGGLFSSVDGVVWEEVERTVDDGGGPAPWDDDLDGVVRGDGVFVAWWGDGVASSTDGVAWTRQTVDCGGGACDPIERVVYLGDGFALLGSRGASGDEATPFLATSADGASWSATEVPVEFVAIAHGGGIYAAASREHLYWSSDGTEWKRGDKTAWDRVRTDIAHGDGLFLAVGEGTVMSSDDGKSWSEEEVSP